MIALNKLLDLANLVYDISVRFLKFDGYEFRNQRPCLGNAYIHTIRSEINSILTVLDNPLITTRELHEEWVSDMLRRGWICDGDTIDIENKKHSSLCCYHKLEESSRILADIRLSIIKSSLKTLEISDGV